MKKQVIGFVLVVVCLHATSCSKDPAMEWIERGNAKYGLKDFQGAIADYDSAIALKPDLVGAYGNRGNAKFALKDLQGAIADYNKTIMLEPDLAGNYDNRGNAKAALGDLQGAIADYNKAIELEPDNAAVHADAYYNRGVTKWQFNDFLGALDDYTKALELRPSFGDVYNNRGTLYLFLGQKDKARADYLKARELGCIVPQKALDRCN